MARKKEAAQVKRLRILSFGAGAVGSYVGGSLALKKHHVVFLEKPAVAEQLSASGLILEIKGKERKIPEPKVVASLSQALELGPYDLAIFALKSFDTLAAAEQMAPYAEGMPPIFCLQNGVENETLLAQALGREKVIPGTLTSAIGRQGIGKVRLEKLRGMGVAADHPISADLASALIDAGLNARLYSHAADMKWSKMLTNLLANASSAILNMPPAEIFAHPELHRLEVLQLREALKVMSAQEIQTVDLPGTPVRALTFAVRSLPVPLSRTLLKNAVGDGRGGKMPSFHIDLHSGRGQTEVTYLNGAVARFGQHFAVPTPVNLFLTETLEAITAGNLPLETYDHQPDRLMADLTARFPQVEEAA